jgi:hypothetical protein
MVATVEQRGPENVRVVNLNFPGGYGPFIVGADNEPERATYGGSIYGIVPPATPTDFVTLQGAAGKTIRLKSAIIAGTATAAANILINLIRRSAVNTAGTQTTVVGQSHDSSDPAASAVFKYATANPTGLGAGVTLHQARLNLAPAANGSVDRLMWQFTWQNDKAPLLRSASEFFAINLNGAAFPGGGALDVDLLWTEE